MVFEEHDYEKFPELSNKQIEEFGFQSPHVQYTEDFIAFVVKVHDGDTITVRTIDRDFDFPIRFLGINSKELNEGGEEARDWLKAKIEKETVVVQIDKTQRVGKYGRLLGRVLYGGLDVGEEQLHLGLALPFGETGEEIPSINKDLLAEKYFEVKI